MKKLLLISNSGRPYLEHCKKVLHEFLGDRKKIAFHAAAAFIPPDEYLGKVKGALEPLGYKISLLDLEKDLETQFNSNEAIFVGGGNTYRLLQKTMEAGWIEPLRKKVEDGFPYVGWSAGSNLVGPTVLSTNDWNVVGLDKFEGLNLVPFNINPHYLEADPMMAQQSETRDMRIAEYHEANTNTVLGIEEETSIWVEDSSYRVVGSGRVRRFEKNSKAVDYRQGDLIKLS